jgi:uncharacterized caspase-like protein
MPLLGKILVVIAAAAIWTTPALAEKRVALVIGNSAYQHAPELKNPRNDAEDMASALGRLGFEVVAGYDLDDRGMAQKVRDFARALDGAETALFFYAGHGLQVKGQNYLAPVNAALKVETDLDFETLPLDLILKQMHSARVSLVFLDACRDNPLTRSLRASTRSTNVGQGLARIDDAAGMMISYSTQPGNVALDGEGRNSPFSKALLNHIETAGASIGDIMIDVRKQVMADTGEKQIPWENSSLTGRFFFKSAGGNSGEATAGVAQSQPALPAPPARTELTVTDSAVDHTFWTSIAASDDPELFREYLRRFPKGSYAVIAQAKLQTLSQPRTSASPYHLAMGAPPTNVVSITPAEPQVVPQQMVEDLQRELKRVACFSGAIDGDWGAASKKALGHFNRSAKLKLPVEQPTQEALTSVKSYSGEVCTHHADESGTTKTKRTTSHSGSSNSGGSSAAVGSAALVGGFVGGVIGSQLRRR